MIPHLKKIKEKAGEWSGVATIIALLFAGWMNLSNRIDGTQQSLATSIAELNKNMGLLMAQLAKQDAEFQMHMNFYHMGGKELLEEQRRKNG